MKNKVVVFTGVQKIEFREEEIPEVLPAGAVLVKTEYTFISAGTELSNLTGKEKQVFIPGSWCAYPWKPGYAQVGRVVAVAETTPPSGHPSAGGEWKVGDRVFTFANHAAYTVRTREDFLIRIPDALDSVTAVATRMAAVAASGLVTFVPEWHSPGWVAVFGLGTVGNLAAQCYKAVGARVIGIDPVEHRRTLAKTCGIEHVIAGGENVLQDIQAITGGERPRVVVEATGVPKVAVDAISLVREHGDVVLVGSPRGDFETSATDLLAQIHYRNLKVHGALEWSLPRDQPEGFNNPSAVPVNNVHDKIKMLFDWVLEGRLKVAPIVSHIVKADDIAKGYEGLLKQPEMYTGVAVEWN